MKKYYKIGEISNLYGIGTDSLRYYEEIGILKPRRDDNGYRMYNISDIRTLNILRDLRSIGFSMAEIKEHLADFNLEKTLSLFRREIRVIDQKTAQLEKLRDQLSSRIEEIEHHLSSDVYGEIEVVRLPARRILALTENVYADEELDFVLKKLQKENENLLYIIGNGDMGATIPLDYISDGGYGHFNSVFYLTEEEEFDDILPEGSYLCTTVKGSYTEAVPAAWKALFAELRARNLTASGDPIEQYVIDNHDTNDDTEYITRLQIPLKEN